MLNVDIGLAKFLTFRECKCAMFYVLGFSKERILSRRISIRLTEQDKELLKGKKFSRFFRTFRVN